MRFFARGPGASHRFVANSNRNVILRSMLKTKTGGIWFCLAMLLLVPAQAADSKEVWEVLNLGCLPQYQQPKEALVGYLKQQKTKGKKNHFCIIAYRILRETQKTEVAYVHWPEGRRLILWEPVIEGRPVEDGLTYSRRQWNLRTDVVATDKDINGSTYLISKPWLRQLQYDCEKNGKKISL